jgi:hypothetical protein
MDTSGAQTLKMIVNGIIFSTGHGQEDYLYIYQYVLDAIRDIHMFYTNKCKVSKVYVNTDTNTIDWPDDYLGLVYLGIPVGGKLWVLTRDNNIITTTTLVNGQETLTPIQGEGINYSHGQEYGLGTTGGRNKFYYTEDQNNRRFFINGVNPLNVILAYQSSGVEDEDTLIPVKYKNAINYYARWQLYLRDDSGDFKRAQLFADMYDQEIKKLVAFEGPTMDEIYDALRSTYTGTLQR